ncbi:MAG: hypothetical protein CMB53_04430 [Euryarchaeota archaeon]|nr:hypothetical protein [Euryarchaeota archaeon]|tara:strand:+ start:33 stop:548 length:516 start_codon:yes stop_codon:yes gene_type:complete
MSESAWMESLTRPSKTLSASAVLLGTWLTLLTIVNLTQGAYSEGRKVLWFKFLTGVKEASTTDMSFVIDDAVFGLVGAVILAAGVMGLNRSHEGGFTSWASGLPTCVMSCLLFSDGDFKKLASSWLVALGVLFYVSWSISETTWVDPGVYSVAIVLISFGVGIGILSESES